MTLPPEPARKHPAYPDDQVFIEQLPRTSRWQWFRYRTILSTDHGPLARIGGFGRTQKSVIGRHHTLTGARRKAIAVIKNIRAQGQRPTTVETHRVTEE